MLHISYFFKDASGGLFVAVDLPTAHALVIARPIADKAQHILRWIAQKQADFMGGIPPRSGAGGSGEPHSHWGFPAHSRISEARLWRGDRSDRSPAHWAGRRKSKRGLCKPGAAERGCPWGTSFLFSRHKSRVRSFRLGQAQEKRFPVLIPARVGEQWRISRSSDIGVSLTKSCPYADSAVKYGIMTI